MKNKIIFLIVLLFTCSCAVYEINGYFVSDSYKYNIKSGSYYYEMKVPSFIDGKNLYFSTVYGSSGRELAALLMVIPMYIESGSNIRTLESNNGKFSIYLNNINKYNRDILKYLSFKIIDNGKEYDSEIKIEKRNKDLYEKWLEGKKINYWEENTLIEYVFPVKINQLSKEFKLIVKYKDNEKVLNLKYKKKLYSRAN